MTPAQFQAQMQRKEIAPAYLFLGAEGYQRARCRTALLDAMLNADEREDGVARHDLGESSLAEVIDDARALSLFAARRVLLIANAEAALPRQKGDDDDGDGESAEDGAALLAGYLKDPSPGVVLLFDAQRFEFEGDERKKLERVGKFYSAIREMVEMRRIPAEEARVEAKALAKKAGVTIEPTALDLLVESLGADLARIAVEIEKLSLYAVGGRTISAEQISLLVPEARATTIFILVNALGRRDRTRGLEILDTLCREGEYLPLALTFLSTQFRLALAAKEAGLRSSGQVQGHFSKAGVPMWGSRAEQVYQTMSRFSKDQLEKALELVFAADRDLRSARPDDRIVMERFVLELTA
jgi:DNA polymerase III subunit delta